MNVVREVAMVEKKIGRDRECCEGKMKIERERGRLIENEEYRKLQKGQGREVKAEGRVDREGEGRKSMEGWQIKK